MKCLVFSNPVTCNSQQSKVPIGLWLNQDHSLLTLSLYCFHSCLPASLLSNMEATFKHKHNDYMSTHVTNCPINNFVQVHIHFEMSYLFESNSAALSSQPTMSNMEVYLLDTLHWLQFHQTRLTHVSQFDNVRSKMITSSQLLVIGFFTTVNSGY